MNLREQLEAAQNSLYKVNRAFERVGTGLLNTLNPEYGKYGAYDKMVSWPFIPIAHSDFLRAMRTLASITDRKWSASEPFYGWSFLDAGCGAGLVPLIASSLGFRASGIDNDPNCVKVASLVCGRQATIKRANILKFSDYAKYKVIYYYCPIRDHKLQRKFEARVEAQAKPGAWIIAAMKQGDEYVNNPQFVEYKAHSGQFRIIQKREVPA